MSLFSLADTAVAFSVITNLFIITGLAGVAKTVWYDFQNRVKVYKNLNKKFLFNNKKYVIAFFEKRKPSWAE